MCRECSSVRRIRKLLYLISAPGLIQNNPVLRLDVPALRIEDCTVCEQISAQQLGYFDLNIATS
jgi:hypothetical protein